MQKSPIHKWRNYRIHLINGGNFQIKHRLLLNICPPFGTKSDCIAAILTGNDHFSKLGRDWRTATRALQDETPEAAITGAEVVVGLGAFNPVLVPHLTQKLRHLKVGSHIYGNTILQPMCLCTGLSLKFTLYWFRFWP